MTLASQAAEELRNAQDRFDRSTRNLTEELSTFRPAKEMMTTCQQVAHCARVIDWFMEGAFRPQGFDMNFEKQIEQVLAIESLADARAWFAKSMLNATATVSAKTDGELAAQLPPGEIMGGKPVVSIVDAITDHTAHHRGALTIYARLNAIAPPDPYTG